MKVTVSNNMVTIDDAHINYSNIRNLYINGNGVGIQLIPEYTKEEVDNILNLCNQLSDKLYQLQDILDNKP